MNSKQIVLIGILVIGALALVGCGNQAQATSTPLSQPAPLVQPEPLAQQPGAGDLTRTNDGGAVTFTVKPLNLGDAQAPTVDFEVAMNTHSVDLAFDLSRLSLLKTDTGVEAAASVWSGPGGGHHVSGILSFPADKVTNARSLTLIIKDVSGVPERTFNWELP